MPQALSSIGNFGSSGSDSNSDSSGGSSWLQRLLPLLMMGGGFAGNLMQQRRFNSLQDLFSGGYKQLLALTPEKLTAMVNQQTQPLSTALQQGVGNNVQAAMAERGLSTAPGIFSTTMAQALAPYAMQNREMALKEVLAKYGMLGNFNLPNGLGQRAPMSDMSGLFRMLMGMTNSQPQPVDRTGSDPSSGLTYPDPSAYGSPNVDWGSVFNTPYVPPAPPSMGSGG